MPDMTREDVAAAYRGLGYSLGWTFLMVPEARLRDAPVCLVGLNPGGHGGDELWSCENGNAYYKETWRGDRHSTLQLQVQEMMRLLGVAEDGFMAAQFIPFRSPNLRSLPRSPEAFAFGRALWKWVIDVSPARLFLCLGADAAAHVAGVAFARPRPGPPLPTGWGKTTIGCYETATSGVDRRVVVRLPHLSSYAIFGRQGGASAQAECSLRDACRL
jgi:hypothetical protein